MPAVIWRRAAAAGDSAGDAGRTAAVRGKGYAADRLRDRGKRSLCGGDTMFATRYQQDTALSVNLVSMTTLLSVVTMPLVVGLSQALGG